MIKGIEPNDSPERFRGLGVDVIFGNGRVRRPRRFRGRRPPPHGEEHSSSPPDRGPPSRASPASTRRPTSPTKRCSTCASPCPRCSSRRGTDRLRNGAGLSPARQRRHGRRHGAAASFRARTPISPPSSRTRSRPRASAIGSARRSRRLRPQGRRAHRRCAAPTARRRKSRDRICCWRSAAPPTSKVSASTPPA